MSGSRPRRFGSPRTRNPADGSSRSKAHRWCPRAGTARRAHGSGPQRGRSAQGGDSRRRAAGGHRRGNVGPRAGPRGRRARIRWCLGRRRTSRGQRSHPATILLAEFIDRDREPDTARPRHDDSLSRELNEIALKGVAIRPHPNAGLGRDAERHDQRGPPDRTASERPCSGMIPGRVLHSRGGS